jgi:hypothetical protein
VLDLGNRDPILEAYFEEQLLAWNAEHPDQDLVSLCYGIKYHGLIIEYNVCGDPTLRGDIDTVSSDDEKKALICIFALTALIALLSTPTSAICLNFQSIPLLTAGAELTQEDSLLRDQVLDRYKAIY